MQVLVTFRHMEPSEALRQYAQQKLERLHKYLHRVGDAHVVLSVEKRQHVAEITVPAKGSTLTAAEETADLYAAIDLAVDKLERQAKKMAAKRRERKHQARRLASPSGDSGAAATHSIVHAERVQVKPMSVDEAVSQMQARKRDFMLFQDADSERVCVLYRRRDGEYGLIEPEVL